MNEDLKWLAENVHEWERGAHYLVKTLDGGCNWIVGKMEIRDNAANYFTRAQWQAAREELSGKPRWDDVVGEWIAQDEDGRWYSFDSQPHRSVCCWHNNPCYREGSGKVLGDWRDTLERRPENHSVEPTEKVWRGPEDGLPPPGMSVTYTYKNGGICSGECEIIAYHGDMVWFKPSCARHRVVPVFDVSFHPIRSEEDMAVEEMMRLAIGHDDSDVGKRVKASCRVMARALYRYGWRKQGVE